MPTINDVKRHMSNPQQADDAFMRAMLTYREEQARSVMLYDLNDRFVGEDGITYRYTDIDALIVCVQSYGYSNTVVFIDYLQMLKIIPKDSKLEKQNTERQTIDEVLDRLRELSEEMEIPIVLISTLNRGQQGYANSIKMEHLKESGGIEYKADVILALNYKDSKESSRKEGLYGSYYEETLHILKNRNGEDGGRMPYKYFGAYGYFEEDETE